MSSFKKTCIRSYAKASAYVNTDAQYWKSYDFPITVKEFTSIDYIDVSAVEPYYIAVTTGPKIDIYHQQTAQVWRSLTRFQKGAYGARFRKDGQLLISGSEEGQVKLFNFRQKQMLRVFRGHEGPVHRVDFVCRKPQVVSFADDKTVNLWDISEEKKILTFDEHKDFVRAGSTSPSSEHIIVSGSYDHSLRVWDSRSGSNVMTFNHGAPVMDIVFYPSGSVFASAGGTEVKVWDAVGGKMLSALSQHHKTITSLSLATDNKRLLSGSLDRHVKVYDLKSYATVHSKDYPAPILSLGVAPGDSTLITGMLSSGAGLLSFEQRTNKDKEEKSSRRTKDPRNAPVANFKILPGDEVITHVQRESLAKYDKMMCRFEFTKTIDLVLQSGVSSRSPHITVSVLRELIRRGGLATALAGRDAKGLNSVFRFLIKNIRNPTHHRVLIEVANTLIDLYGDTVGSDSKMLAQFGRLNDELELDILVSKSGIGLMGAIEMFLTASTPRQVENLETPSAKADDAFNSEPASLLEKAESEKIVVDVC